MRPTRSIGILYDKRDPLARLALDLIETVPIFRDFTDTEKTTISNRSTKIFTLSAIHQATLALLGKKKGDVISEDDLVLARSYWSHLCEIIPEWRQAIKRQVNGFDLRTQYVHSHGVALHALGIAGRALITAVPDTWPQRLEPLAHMDWRRANTKLWEGRAMHHGKMSKAWINVNLTANAIKQILGLSLTEDDAAIEHQVNGYRPEREIV